MSNRALFLFVCALVAAGYGIVTHWETISSVLGIGAPARERALELAREDATIDPQRTNDEIARDIANAEYVEAIGWRVDHGTENVFLVRFEYLDDGERSALLFEVDLAAGTVRRVEVHAALEARYGLGQPAKPR